jgi:hypothetical protein
MGQPRYRPPCQRNPARGHNKHKILWTSQDDRQHCGECGRALPAREVRRLLAQDAQDARVGRYTPWLLAAVLAVAGAQAYAWRGWPAVARTYVALALVWAGRTVAHKIATR